MNDNVDGKSVPGFLDNPYRTEVTPKPLTNLSKPPSLFLLVASTYIGHKQRKWLNDTSSVQEVKLPESKNRGHPGPLSLPFVGQGQTE